MTKDQLIAKLKTIVEPYIQDEHAFANLSEDTDFINDLKINSANLVDVVLDVEDEFDIRIENEDMERMCFCSFVLWTKDLLRSIRGSNHRNFKSLISAKHA